MKDDRIAQSAAVAWRDLAHDLCDACPHANLRGRIRQPVTAFQNAVRPARLGWEFERLVVVCGCVLILLRLGGAGYQPEAATAAVHQNPPRQAPLLHAIQSPPHPAPRPEPAVLDAPVSFEEQTTRLRLQLTTARHRCLTRLHENPKYQTAFREADALEGKVRTLRSSDPEGELSKASFEWMEAKNVLGRMSAAALADDGDVQRLERELRLRGSQPR